jgi:hypothetical protein
LATKNAGEIPIDAYAAVFSRYRKIVARHSSRGLARGFRRLR